MQSHYPGLTRSGRSAPKGAPPSVISTRHGLVTTSRWRRECRNKGRPRRRSDRTRCALCQHGADLRWLQGTVEPEVKEAEVVDTSAIFLLSPARLDRTRYLLSPVTMFPVARALHSTAGAPIGEIFTFLSGLYLRGRTHAGQPSR